MLAVNQVRDHGSHAPSILAFVRFRPHLWQSAQQRIERDWRALSRLEFGTYRKMIAGLNANMTQIHPVGASSSGLLFLTLTTAASTFQAFICPAENGFSKSIGNCDGTAGANHLS